MLLAAPVQDAFEPNDSPQAVCDLGGIPAGHDYDLGVYYECLSGETANVACGATAPAENAGRNGCCSRNGGTLPESAHVAVACGALTLDDSGDVYVILERVSGAATCTLYSLSLADD